MTTSRWQLRLTVAGGAFLLLLLTAAWLERRTGERRLERVRQDLLSRGEKLSWEGLAPPAPPSNENGYNEMQQALAGFTELGWIIERMPRYPLSTNGKAVLWRHMVDWRVSPASKDEETNRVTWDQFQQHLAPMASSIAAARAAISKPYIDGRPNYAAGMRMPLPHLAPMKRLATCLSAQAASDVRAGLPGEAVDNVEAVLRLGEHLRREPLLISQLVQISIQAMAVPISWQLVHSGLLSPKDLLRLQEAWTRAEAQGSLAKGVAGDRVWNLSAFEEARSSTSNFLAITENSFFASSPSTPTDFFEFVASAGPQTGRSTRALLWRHLFWPSDQAFQLETTQAMIETHQLAAAGASARELSSKLHAITNALTRLSEESPAGNLRTAFSERLLPSLASSFRRGLRAEAQRRLVITAIALQRHHLQHGRYPSTLQGLAPDYLTAPLLDPYDGFPLRYACAGDGNEFKLYAVGEDLVDNGGRIAEKAPTAAYASMWQAWTGSPDVIWPMPASEAEARSTLRPAE